MKLFAAICGTAALVTAAYNHHILSRFAKMYGHLETPLPDLTRALLWKGGMGTTGLFLASAIVVFTGLLRKNNGLMVAGGVSVIVLMLGAATIVPTALIVPVEKVLHDGDTGVARPAPAPVPAKDDSIRN
ncbi:hypothetical protein OKA05_13750 [Luteolibacter arcticus]|uniref:Uncharacterized protein n=1 Tax=Luteolibacter arcticus TaxID=1581411 RepID=A0ABT3GJD8_9BACT|nr:hypothetical protein [Luteolibacter arcticus]MCW1923624.1 hypothetical protein [Luteolibacter arcticus]